MWTQYIYHMTAENWIWQISTTWIRGKKMNIEDHREVILKLNFPLELKNATTEKEKKLSKTLPLINLTI